MKRFREVYAFMAIDEIRDGKTVLLLDREKRTVEIVNDMTVADAVELTSSKDENRGRFEFWVEEEVEETEENDNERA